MRALHETVRWRNLPVRWRNLHKIAKIVKIAKIGFRDRPLAVPHCPSMGFLPIYQPFFGVFRSLLMGFCLVEVLMRTFDSFGEPCARPFDGVICQT